MPDGERRGTIPLFLGDGDRYTLAALGPATAENFATPAGFLASAKPVGALAALVMRLIGTLHGLDSTRRGARSILKGAGEVKPAPDLRPCGGDFRRGPECTSDLFALAT
jgi:hypothetical protein